MLRASSAYDHSLSLCCPNRRLVSSCDTCPRTCSETLSTYPRTSYAFSDSMVGYFLCTFAYLEGVR
jgi:hypothetical protein